MKLLSNFNYDFLSMIQNVTINVWLMIFSGLQTSRPFHWTTLTPSVAIHTRQSSLFFSSVHSKMYEVPLGGLGWVRAVAECKSECLVTYCKCTEWSECNWTVSRTRVVTYILSRMAQYGLCANNNCHQINYCYQSVAWCWLLHVCLGRPIDATWTM